MEQLSAQGRANTPVGWASASALAFALDVQGQFAESLALHRDLLKRLPADQPELRASSEEGRRFMTLLAVDLPRATSLLERDRTEACRQLSQLPGTSVWSRHHDLQDDISRLAHRRCSGCADGPTGFRCLTPMAAPRDD